MKKLLLMRHADALSLDFINDDFHRILSPIGQQQAVVAGKFINKNFTIDRVLTSPSSRTLETISIITQQCGIPGKILEIPTSSKEEIHRLHANKDMPLKLVEAHAQLYCSSYQKVLQIISEQQDNEEFLMVLGHNPEIFKVAVELSGKHGNLYEQLISHGMTTAMIVVLELIGLENWQNLKESSGTITEIFIPG